MLAHRGYFALYCYLFITRQFCRRQFVVGLSVRPSMFVRWFIRPDRSCYHDASWTHWAISMKLTSTSPYWWPGWVLKVKGQGHSRPSRWRRHTRRRWGIEVVFSRSVMPSCFLNHEELEPYSNQFKWPTRLCAFLGRVTLRHCRLWFSVARDWLYCHFIIALTWRDLTKIVLTQKEHRGVNLLWEVMHLGRKKGCM